MLDTLMVVGPLVLFAIFGLLIGFFGSRWFRGLAPVIGFFAGAALVFFLVGSLTSLQVTSVMVVVAAVLFGLVLASICGFVGLAGMTVCSICAGLMVGVGLVFCLDFLLKYAIPSVIFSIMSVILTGFIVLFCMIGQKRGRTIVTGIIGSFVTLGAIGLAYMWITTSASFEGHPILHQLRLLYESLTDGMRAGYILAGIVLGGVLAWVQSTFTAEKEDRQELKSLKKINRKKKRVVKKSRKSAPQRAQSSPFRRQGGSSRPQPMMDEDMDDALPDSPRGRSAAKPLSQATGPIGEIEIDVAPKAKAGQPAASNAPADDEDEFTSYYRELDEKRKASQYDDYDDEDAYEYDDEDEYDEYDTFDGEDDEAYDDEDWDDYADDEDDYESPLTDSSHGPLRPDVVPDRDGFKEGAVLVDEADIAAEEEPAAPAQPEQPDRAARFASRKPSFGRDRTITEDLPEYRQQGGFVSRAERHRKK